MRRLGRTGGKPLVRPLPHPVLGELEGHFDVGRQREPTDNGDVLNHDTPAYWPAIMRMTCAAASSDST